MTLTSFFNFFKEKGGSRKDRTPRGKSASSSGPRHSERSDPGTPSNASGGLLAPSADPDAPITGGDLTRLTEELASGVKPWDTGTFTFVKTLQSAVRNHGRVDVYKLEGSCTGGYLAASLGHVVEEREAGRQVAVKRMPTRWVRSGPEQFNEHYPRASERPWFDLGVTRLLNERGFPHVCTLHGVYRDEENTFVMMSLASDGDLFSWCDNKKGAGPEREAVMRPILKQVFEAIQFIHNIGIAHRDLSLENILLTSDGQGGHKVTIIDFGMGTLNRQVRREVCGKQSYQAPEMHAEEVYDTFLADAFALGVVTFAMAVQDYPWISTKRNSCQLFEYVCQFGLGSFLSRRKLRKGNGEYLKDVISPELFELLDGLLAMTPQSRLTLGEMNAFVPNGQDATKAARATVWETRWLSEDRHQI